MTLINNHNKNKNTFQQFTEEVQKDKDTIKFLEDRQVYIINYVLQKDDLELLTAVCKLFGRTEILPEYKKLSDLKIIQDTNTNTSQFYFVNFKNDIYYLYDSSFQNLSTLEELYNVSSRQFCDAGESETEFHEYINFMEGQLKRNFTMDEINFIRKSANEYSTYHEVIFPRIIARIVLDNSNIDSETDCSGILHQYIDRTPTRWETAILWDSY